MTEDDATSRWIELLGALRAEHLERLHAFGRRVAFASLVFAGGVALASVLALDTLWDLSFYDSDTGFELASLALLAFVSASASLALALRQQRRDRSAAIALLDRAIPRLVSGAEPKAVLEEVSEGMAALTRAPREVGAWPHLPSLLDRRWLGTTAYTKVWLGCALLVLASLLLGAALSLSVPPPAEGDFESGAPTAATSLRGA